MCSASQTDATSVATLPALQPLTEEAEFDAAHTFSSFANWIIPGKVLVGRYPYVEPSRCRTHDQGEAQVQQILQQGGVTTFISLQAEVPPQAEMTMGGVNGFVPYASVATLLVSAMSGPPSMKEVNGLRNEYLDTFLPPRRKQQRHQREDEEERMPRRKLAFLHYPITDLDIPTPEQVRELIGEIERRVQAGEVLYVHCWGGRGRAGTVGACLLAQLYGLDAEQALARVQRAYNTRGELGYGSPETLQQVNFVKAFVNGK
ncbi:probable cyclin-dependent kinase inhibitor 3 at C-terminar half [Coccomyxa sp. Obi]|nr:probable cyclin-dependent kinase inhibitor 3 at C-terminar half [Coccomyxa sp. Obi]